MLNPVEFEVAELLLLTMNEDAVLLSARRRCRSAVAAEGQALSLVAQRSHRRRKPHVAGS